MSLATVAPQSGVQGITWRKHPKKWAVRAYRGPLTYWLGTFVHLRDAKKALEEWHAGNPAQPVSKPTKKEPARINLTPEQVSYAMSIAHEIRGF